MAPTLDMYSLEDMELTHVIAQEAGFVLEMRIQLKYGSVYTKWQTMKEGEDVGPGSPWYKVELKRMVALIAESKGATHA